MPSDAGGAPITQVQDRGADTRLAELAGAFSIAGDLGRGQPVGHSLRTCYLALQIANRMDLRIDEQRDVYLSALLVHAGCTAGSSQFAALLAGDELAAMREMYLCDPGNVMQMLGWIGRHVSPEASLPTRTQRLVQALLRAERTMADVDRGCSDVGARVAERLGLPDGTRDSLFHICELWNGRGPHKLQGKAIPTPTRIVNAALVLEVFHRAEGRKEAISAARKFRGRYFDPDVSDAFLALVEDAPFWDGMEEEDQWSQVMAMEPGPERLPAGDDLLDVFLEALADFADLKSKFTAGRSRETARLAEGIALRLGLHTDQVAVTRRAALVHDLGLVGISSHVLDRPGTLSEVEEQQLRLHSYYTHFILARVPALQEVGTVAGMHHEWINGQGYHRGLSARSIPVAARAVAIASEYVNLLRGGPARHPLLVEEAIAAVSRQVGTRFDADCSSALAAQVSSAGAAVPRHQSWPKDLTAREVEVLRLVSRGLSRRAVAQQLFVSEHTVRHHLESVYGKIGVSSRAGAVLFAVENGLVA